MKKPTLEQAFGYQGDNMNLPVGNLAAALPFYESVLGFQCWSAARRRTVQRCWAAIRCVSVWRKTAAIRPGRLCFPC